MCTCMAFGFGILAFGGQRLTCRDCLLQIPNLGRPWTFSAILYAQWVLEAKVKFNRKGKASFCATFILFLFFFYIWRFQYFSFPFKQIQGKQIYSCLYSDKTVWNQSGHPRGHRSRNSTLQFIIPAVLADSVLASLSLPFYQINGSCYYYRLPYNVCENCLLIYIQLPLIITSRNLDS